MPRDGKGRFFKTLNFDKPTKKLLYWYRKLKYSIDFNLALDKDIKDKNDRKIK